VKVIPLVKCMSILILWRLGGGAEILGGYRHPEHVFLGETTDVFDVKKILKNFTYTSSCHVCTYHLLEKYKASGIYAKDNLVFQKISFRELNFQDTAYVFSSSNFTPTLSKDTKKYVVKKSEF
jgi:hypothetical protein